MLSGELCLLPKSPFGARLKHLPSSCAMALHRWCNRPLYLHPIYARNYLIIKLVSKARKRHIQMLLIHGVNTKYAILHFTILRCRLSHAVCVCVHVIVERSACRWLLVLCVFCVCIDWDSKVFDDMKNMSWTNTGHAMRRTRNNENVKRALKVRKAVGRKHQDQNVKWTKKRAGIGSERESHWNIAQAKKMMINAFEKGLRRPNGKLPNGTRTDACLLINYLIDQVND